MLKMKKCVVEKKRNSRNQKEHTSTTGKKTTCEQGVPAESKLPIVIHFLITQQ
jgi:hypothetical protein